MIQIMLISISYIKYVLNAYVLMLYGVLCTLDVLQNQTGYEVSCVTQVHLE